MSVSLQQQLVTNVTSQSNAEHNIEVESEIGCLAVHNLNSNTKIDADCAPPTLLPDTVNTVDTVSQGSSTLFDLEFTSSSDERRFDCMCETRSGVQCSRL